MKFSIFGTEKKSLYIAWASFRNVCGEAFKGRASEGVQAVLRFIRFMAPAGAM